MLAELKAAKSVREASDIVLTQYERPADQSENVKKKRASYGQKYYDRYAKTTGGKSSMGKTTTTATPAEMQHSWLCTTQEIQRTQPEQTPTTLQEPAEMRRLISL